MKIMGEVQPEAALGFAAGSRSNPSSTFLPFKT